MNGPGMLRRCRIGFAALLLAAGCSGDRPEMSTPAPPGSQLPNLATRADGAVVLSWVEPAEDGHRLAYAVLANGRWGKPGSVAEGQDWFVNWADVPSVVPLDGDLWAAHWLVKGPGGTYAYDVALALSVDGGVTWGEPLQPHLDDSPAEHGFVSLWPTRADDGAPAAGLVWLDGRHMVRDVASAAEYDPRTVLRAAVVAADGRVLARSEVDGRVCDCCRTAVAPTPAGPVIAYRDRTREEVRDILLAIPSGGGWQQSQAIASDGWTITGCPVNGPALASRGPAVAAAWYTQAGGDGRVRFASRPDVDGAWTPTIDVATSSLGRVDVAWLDGGQAAVSWMSQTGEDQADILVARIDADGHRGEPVRVARTRASRPAGFPRLARQGDRLIVAWTRWAEEGPRIQSRVVVASLAVAELPGPL